MGDWYRGPDPNWHAKLQAAQAGAYGDPVTGETYEHAAGGYNVVRIEKGGVVAEFIGPKIAIAFDGSTNLVIKHGAPEDVERYAKAARREYTGRDDDINQLPRTLGVIHMPEGFPAREINLVLADPKYMVELIRQAEKALEVSEDGKLLPAGEG